MNKGLIIVLVLVGAVALLCLCGVVMPKGGVTPPRVEESNDMPTIEERGDADYKLADEGMESELQRLETRDYVNPELNVNEEEMSGVVGYGGDVGAAL